MEPDYDAIKTGELELSIMFIILICLANGMLIARQVRKPLFHEKLKLMTIISLSIGDVIFALFPLVVMVILILASDLSFLTCRLIVTYTTYSYYLIHFVYGIGLVVLGFEVLLRHKIPANWNKTINALTVSSVPWILGLVIILPLCMANVDYDDSCRNIQSVDSRYGVSVFFPASLAVVVTAILNFVHMSTNEEEQSVNTNQQAVVYSQENVVLPLTNTPQYNPQIITQDTIYKHQYPNNQQPNVNDQQGPPLYPQIVNESNHYASPYTYQPSIQHNTKQENLNLYNYNQQSVPQSSFAVNVPNNQVNLVVVTPSNRRTEVQRLLVISILFFILVVPFASIGLNITKINWSDKSTEIVVLRLVYWVMVSRSCITSMIMLKYSDL